MFWLKERLLWIGIIVVFAVILVFGLALLAPSLSAKPSELPVALVLQDEAVILPDGSELAVGEMITEKVTALDELPLKWEVVETEEAALYGLTQQEYYAALILPVGLSEHFSTLMTPFPQQGTVKVLINEGMNAQAATVVKQMLNQMLERISTEMSRMVVAQYAQRTDVIALDVFEALRQPLQVERHILHPIGENQAQGNAPNLLTQILWLSCLVTSVFMFMISRKQMSGGERGWVSIGAQTATGLFISCVASMFLLWMAATWYNMDIQHFWQVWLFIWLVASTFYLLQSSLLNILGYRALPILILLFFFSMPVLSVAPEFLPQTAKTWLYSWTPFRFAASGIRDLLYFGGTERMGTYYLVLWSLAGAAILLNLLAALRNRSTEATEIKIKEV